ncbi:MAG: enoyl-CoA hydratase/isomerase family protein [Actinomycetota bacterium]|jgi:Delta3-Delta2-enoyl-CoA isomerase|nr:enoyl-CoA hydratase/isomerase family protein [Actinomycetota bacterium]
MIELERHDDVFVLTMVDDENRWNTSFTKAFEAAIDEVAASEGAAAMVTASANEKFFSNGLDLEWVTSKGEHRGGDRKVFADEYMKFAAKLITLPVPTVCAVNGHAFGAGFMIALCHDIRIMREDRGFMCANEAELGFAIPVPELSLFHHKIPAPSFHETVVLAKRWSGPAAKAAGFVESVVPRELVLEAAIDRAASLAHLARHREVFGWHKEQLYGEGAAINTPDGPAHLLRNLSDYASGPGKIPSSPNS